LKRDERRAGNEKERKGRCNGFLVDNFKKPLTLNNTTGIMMINDKMDAGSSCAGV
jgi:hypothetical protein